MYIRNNDDKSDETRYFNRNNNTSRLVYAPSMVKVNRRESVPFFLSMIHRLTKWPLLLVVGTIVYPLARRQLESRESLLEQRTRPVKCRFGISTIHYRTNAYTRIYSDYMNVHISRLCPRRLSDGTFHWDNEFIIAFRQNL